MVLPRTQHLHAATACPARLILVALYQSAGRYRIAELIFSILHCILCPSGSPANCSSEVTVWLSAITCDRTGPQSDSFRTRSQKTQVSAFIERATVPDG